MLHILIKVWRWRPALGSRFTATITNHGLQKQLLPPDSTPPPRPRQKKQAQLDAGIIDVPAIQRRLREVGFDLDLLLVGHPRHPIHTRWATVKLFLDEGFTAEQISTLLNCRRVLLMPYPDLVSRIHFLKTLNATEESTVEFLTSQSPIATLRVENLKQKMECLESLGSDPEMLKKMVIRRRWLVTTSADTLRRRVRWLQDFGVDSKGITQILRKSPYFLTLNPARNLLPKIASLESQGASRAVIVKAMKARPALFSLSLASMLRRIEQYQQLGIGKDSNQLLYVFFQLSIVSTERVAKRFNWFIEQGLSPDQVRRIVVSYPLALARSEGSMAKKIDFLTKVSNVDIKELLKFPQFLGLSLENRIIPRFKLLADAKEKGKVQRQSSLWTVLRLTDIQFQEWLVKKGMNARKTSEETDPAMEGPKQVKEAG